jgi:hypothetical protein
MYDELGLDTPWNIPRVMNYMEFYNIIHNTTEEEWAEQIVLLKKYLDYKAQELEITLEKMLSI